MFASTETWNFYLMLSESFALLHLPQLKPIVAVCQKDAKDHGSLFSCQHLSVFFMELRKEKYIKTGKDFVCSYTCISVFYYYAF